MRHDPASQATPGNDARPDAGGAAFSLGWKDACVAAFLLVATLLVYRPVWHAGFIWDDNGHITRPDLQSLHGLWRIWFEPGATQQYYPFLHTAFWVEHRLWGDAAPAYHIANLCLHALVAFLFYILLRRLAMPGSFFAATAFALHPVCVETAAWISEEKNTLSAVFYLGSALTYLAFDRRRRGGLYAAALGLFALALATKTVTATLPAALLVLFWWQRGRLSWKRDVAPLLPWFALAAASGWVTAWVENRFIGASGEAFTLGFMGRLNLAAHALWFYLGKALWPTDLSFIYPHWDVVAAFGCQWLYFLCVLLVAVRVYIWRRRSRGPMAAFLLFAGTLFPALGFINVYPFIYSYVADHFQYLALAVVVASVAALAALAIRRLSLLSQRIAIAAAAGLVALLALLTTAQCRAYVDAETLWHATLAANPDCWMAYQNLGGVYMKEGRVFQAIAQFEEAIDLRPNDHEALNELGVAQMQAGHNDRALAAFQRALAAAPNSTETHLNLGVLLLQAGSNAEAAQQFQGVIEVDPSNAKARRSLASALFLLGNPKEAEDQFAAALKLEPADAQTHSDLGAALAADGRPDDAIAQFNAALHINPRLSVALVNLGGSLMKAGRFAEAADALGRAVALEPNDARLRNNLGIALVRAGHPQEALEQFRRAVAIDPGYRSAQRNLAGLRHALGQQ
jgi:tetratricopeptide (TPR) repeat protein